jgi:hypothetical protein
VRRDGSKNLGEDQKKTGKGPLNFEYVFSILESFAKTLPPPSFLSFPLWICEEVIHSPVAHLLLKGVAQGYG